MNNNDNEFTRFIEVNGAFLITTFGMCGGMISGLTLYFLKSRCTNIDCFCCKCQREPLSENQLSSLENNV